MISAWSVLLLYEFGSGTSCRNGSSEWPSGTSLNALGNTEVRALNRYGNVSFMSMSINHNQREGGFNIIAFVRQW